MCAAMKKAVVTGASGFLGLPLCKALLEKGVVVFAFRILHNPWFPAKFP